jgi:hypothetical protein
VFPASLWKSFFKSWRTTTLGLPWFWLLFVMLFFFSSKRGFDPGFWSHPLTYASLLLCCLPAAAVAGYIRWLIIHTPTSKVADAPRGRVELVGTAHVLPDAAPLKAPMSGRACLGYCYVKYVRQGRTSRCEAFDERTVDAFLVRDESGTCVVRPADAMVSYGASIERREGGLWRSVHETEQVIPIAELVYVLGWMSEPDPHSEELGIRLRADRLLERWRRRKRTLLMRFDANRNRQVDASEWLVAKEEALRTAREAHRSTPRGPLAVVHAPPSGGLYLIIADRPHWPERGWTIQLLLFGGVGLAALGKLADLIAGPFFR